MSFEKIAFDLYGLPLDEFVAARDERAADARKQKDRELATALKGLAKPTVGAWAVNQLVRRERQLLERVLAVGDGLREAQLRLDGERLRELSTQRRQLMAEVTAELRSMGVSEGAEQEALETLAAAVAEATVGAEVRAGRVTRGLQHSGFGGLAGMLAAQVASVPEAQPGPEGCSQPDSVPEPEVRGEPQPEARPDPEPEPEPQAKPEPEPPKAPPLVKTLRHRLETAQEALEEARSDRDTARERVESIRERLQLAKDKLKAAEEAFRKAEADRDEIQGQLDEL